MRDDKLFARQVFLIIKTLEYVAHYTRNKSRVRSCYAGGGRPTCYLEYRLTRVVARANMKAVSTKAAALLLSSAV